MHDGARRWAGTGERRRAEIYHATAPAKQGSATTSIRRLRPTFVSLNVAMYIVFGTLYAVDLGVCLSDGGDDCEPAFPTFNTTFQV